MWPGGHKMAMNGGGTHVAFPLGLLRLGTNWAPPGSWLMSKKKDKTVFGKLMKLDRDAHDAVEPYQDSPPVKAISWVSEIGDQPQMLTLSGGVLAYGLLAKRPDLKRAGVRMVAAHLLATVVKDVVKHRVDRTRPHALKKGKDHKPKPGRNGSKEETSFPSGHSAGALAVALAFARELPQHRIKALSGAGLIAAAQVPRCSHYPTDVGVGLAIGWAAEAAINAAAGLMKRSRKDASPPAR
jgi:membrane-associated phospholipid phosphatase